MQLHTEEEARIIKRIRDNCALLISGYQEAVEYTTKAYYHRGQCENYGNKDTAGECECPTSNEKRVRRINRPGYLRQLKDFAANKDTDRAPKAERGAPRGKVPGRPPGDMAGFFAADELECAITAAVDRALEATGRDRSWAAQPVAAILGGLATQAGYMIDLGEIGKGVAEELDRSVSSWVDQARRTLRVNAGDAMLEGVVCGNCGGGLTTPWGSASEGLDVRCAGTPDRPSCGHTYPPSEWVALYEERTTR